jgi:hypothetical protein
MRRFPRDRPQGSKCERKKLFTNPNIAVTPNSYHQNFKTEKGKVENGKDSIYGKGIIIVDQFIFITMRKSKIAFKNGYSR